ncbi:orotate phosphoribosyltransferase [Roseospira visakhapatnamensis]|uniref:Orotate phosphoribosyltransferase n=1 Tax=Roseospira visakhapatnamensis TaxID=390880 RepID=A0A7W6R9K3_9PROT|nr:orotate phosphoribosyltransferase [Roseospira visakhapatnamensis]MBB4264446.1 orotate phosphoribosyltransferase [Roseospira visakhapatnamensis]
MTDGPTPDAPSHAAQSHAARDPRQKEAGRQVARILLDIGAVNFRPEDPYRLTAGWASPVYIDGRRVIAFPRARRRVIDLARETLERDVGAEAFDAVAGGETAGIPYAAWLSDALMLPMLYVRKKPKGFGRMAQIEGTFREGDRVVLVEDLATDGGSKLVFCNALRAAGAEVRHAFVVFFYGVFPGALKTLEDAGLTLHFLANWWDVLEEAEHRRAFSPEAIEGVRAFLQDPIGWSAAHGGRGAEGPDD